MPVRVFIQAEWPKMFLCSVLEWAIYAYKYMYVYTHIQSLYESVKAKCDQEAVPSTANSDMYTSVFFGHSII